MVLIGDSPQNHFESLRILLSIFSSEKSALDPFKLCSSLPRAYVYAFLICYFAEVRLRVAERRSVKMVMSSSCSQFEPVKV